MWEAWAGEGGDTAGRRTDRCQDLPSLSEEVDRLRGLFRQHGLDAEDGTA